jgi:hypothetical protein
MALLSIFPVPGDYRVNDPACKIPAGDQQEENNNEIHLFGLLRQSQIRWHD